LTLSSREAPYPESFETKKKAEIDAAWEAHNFVDYAAQIKERAAQVEERHRWLEAHLISQKGLCGYCSIVTTDAVLSGTNIYAHETSFGQTIGSNFAGSGNRRYSVVVAKIVDSFFVFPADRTGRSQIR
jgi:hypothetical protein